MKWFKRKTRFPNHNDFVMCSYRDGVVIADNRKRELLYMRLDEYGSGEWKIEIVGKF